MCQRKGSHYLQEPQKVSSTQEQSDEKEEMIIPGENVLNPAPKEAGIMLRRLRIEGHSHLTRLW
jgi:hypothetical protein